MGGAAGRRREGARTARVNEVLKERVSRRGFLRALGFVAVAPAIVRASSLMDIKPFDALYSEDGFQFTGFESTIPLSHLRGIPRAFIPSLFVQIYRNDPLLLDMMARA